jgi:GTP-binding protein
MFIDRVIIYVKGGDGGRGMVCFHREKYVPLGGPSGGDGGRGGDVIVRAVAGTDSLAQIAHIKHWRGDNGGGGGPNNRHGADGGDVVIQVPPGTVVRDRDRGNILRDLTQDTEEVIVAKGGRGGRGNRHFATPVNRTPREAEPGESGEERWLVLELKLIADVGLLGLPNAGKSMLLSRLSRAQPEVGDYPFTTKHPNLGVVYFGGDAAFVLADLPGLIEGAHVGVGLGHEFLRHVERTRVLVHLIEPHPADGSDPVQNYQMLRNELALYSAKLAMKPELLIVSKMDLTGAQEILQRVDREIGRETIGISAVTGQGLSELVNRIAGLLREVREREAPQPVEQV